MPQFEYRVEPDRRVPNTFKVLRANQNGQTWLVRIYQDEDTAHSVARVLNDSESKGARE